MNRQAVLARPEVETAAHPAIQAWLESGASRRPHWIETLKESKKSGVYRLAGAGPRGVSVIAKRCRPHTAAGERFVHDAILAHCGMPVLRRYGQIDRPDEAMSWLFLEDAGEERYCAQRSDHRALAARWLAAVHGYVAERCDLATRLQNQGPDEFLTRLRRLRETIFAHRGNPALGAADDGVLQRILGCCDLLESQWGKLKTLCDGLAPSLVHNDFSEKNLRIRKSPNGLALLVFDWESGGWGTPACDLAQFAGHSASPDLRTYWAALPVSARRPRLADVHRAAHAGRIFRFLSIQSWQAHNLCYPWARTTVQALGEYDALLRRAMAAAGLER